jgi:transposase
VAGKGISAVGSVRYERQQVDATRVIKMVICEHRSEIKCCPHCQKQNEGVFPAALSRCTQYGYNLKQFVVYLTQYQLLPLVPAAQLIEDITG